METSAENWHAPSPIDALWSAAVEPVLVAVSPATIAHFGARDGEATRGLLSFCARTDARAHLIEPRLELNLQRLEDLFPDAVVCHRGTAVEELPGLGPDLAMLDETTDSVDRILELLESDAEGAAGYPVVVVSGGGDPSPIESVEAFVGRSSLDLELLAVPDGDGIGVLAARKTMEPALVAVLERLRDSEFKRLAQNRLRGRPSPGSRGEARSARASAGPSGAVDRQGSGPVDLERQLDAMRDEKDELRGRLDASHRRQQVLGRKLDDATQTLRKSREQAAARANELEAARRNLARVREAADGEKAERRRLLGERKKDKEERRRLQAELKRATAELKRADAEIAKLSEDAERISKSRSWRLGHGAMKLLRRVSFRPLRGEDSLEKLASRLRALQDRLGRVKSG